MNDVLCQFYKCLRTKAGGFYKKASYLSARASFGCYVTVDLKRPLNIFQTPELQVSNRVLKAVLIENRMCGESSTEHKIPILHEDVSKLDL